MRLLEKFINITLKCKLCKTINLPADLESDLYVFVVRLLYGISCQYVIQTFV